MLGTGLSRLGALPLLLLLAGCAMAPPAQTSQSACSATGTQMCLRPLLAPDWIKWPPGDGSQGEEKEITLAAGTLIDRFGGDGGAFFSPKGIPYGQRALPYVCEVRAYRIFRVQKSFDVTSGTIKPWFGEPGLGTQYHAKQSVADLVKAGNIVEVPAQPGDSPC